MRFSYVLTGTLTAVLLSTVSVEAVRAADMARAVAPVPVMPTILPAVSGLNGKIEVGAGGEWGDSPFDDGFLGYIAGSIAMPLSQQWGAQFDGYLGSSQGEAAYGLGGHVFWRDPASGLLGAYAEVFGTDTDDGSLTKGRVGPEGELYWGRFNLSGIAGVEFGNRGVDTNFFADVVGSYFATDDLRLYAGFTQGFAGFQGKFGVEYQLANFSNTSVFAEGHVGEDGYAAAFAGVKIQLGAPNKSLIRHYREDDPQNWLKQTVHDVNQATAKGKFKKSSGIPYGCS